MFNKGLCPPLDERAMQALSNGGNKTALNLNNIGND